MTSIPLIVLGVLAAVVIWIAQRQTLSTAIRIALSLGIVAIAVVAVFVFILPAVGFLGAKRWYEESPWRECIFLLLMMVGMAVRYLTGAIEERRDRIKALIAKGENTPKVPLQFDAWEFSYPLLFSVVTFGGLLAQIKDDGPTLTNVILSFQTGFFWQTLLKRQALEAKVV